MASTVFAGQHMATFARQYVLAMSRATDLADLAAARSFKFSELATVLALMVYLQLLCHSHHALSTNSRFQRPWSLSVNNLLSSSSEQFRHPVATQAFLPLYTTSVAELGATSTTAIWVSFTYTTGSSKSHSRHVITALIPKHHFTASKTGLPALLIREINEALPCLICWAIPIMCQCFAVHTSLTTTGLTGSTIRGSLRHGNKLGALRVSAVNSVRAGKLQLSTSIGGQIFD